MTRHKVIQEKYQRLSKISPRHTKYHKHRGFRHSKSEPNIVRLNTKTGCHKGSEMLVGEALPKSLRKLLND